MSGLETPPDQWFRRALAHGMAHMVALSLPGTPPHETIALTREAWAEALWPGRAWNAAQDQQRIAAAFRTLATTCERWPTPAQFLRALPERAPQQRLAPPVTPPNAEQRAKIAALLREATQRMTARGR